MSAICGEAFAGGSATIAAGSPVPREIGGSGNTRSGRRSVPKAHDRRKEALLDKEANLAISPDDDGLAVSAERMGQGARHVAQLRPRNALHCRHLSHYETL